MTLEVVDRPGDKPDIRYGYHGGGHQVNINGTDWGNSPGPRGGARFVAWVFMVDAIPAALEQAEQIVNDDRYTDEQAEQRLHEEAWRQFSDDPVHYDRWDSAHLNAQLAWGFLQDEAENLLAHADQLQAIADLAEQALSEDPEERQAAQDGLKEMLKDPNLDEELRDAIEDFLDALQTYNEFAMEAFYWFYGYLPCTQAAADWCAAGNHPDCWDCEDECKCYLANQETGEPWSPNGSDGEGGGGGGGGGGAGAPQGPALPPGGADAAPQLLAAEAGPAPAVMPAASAPAPAPTRPEVTPVPGVGPEVALDGKRGRFAYAMAGGADPLTLMPGGTRSTLPDAAPAHRTTQPSQSHVTEQPPGTEPGTPSSATSEVVPCATCEEALAASAGMSTDRAIWCLAYAAGRILAARNQRLSDHIDVNDTDREAVLEALRRFCRGAARPTGPRGAVFQEAPSGSEPVPADAKTAVPLSCWDAIARATSVAELRTVAATLGKKDPRVAKDEFLNKAMSAAPPNLDPIKARLRLYCVLATTTFESPSRDPSFIDTGCAAVIKDTKTQLDNNKPLAAAARILPAVLTHAPGLLGDANVQVALGDLGLIQDDDKTAAFVQALLTALSAWCTPPSPEEPPPEAKNSKYQTEEATIRKRARTHFPKPTTADAPDKCKEYMMRIRKAVDDMTQTGNFASGGEKSYAEAMSLGGGGTLAAALPYWKIAAVMAQESSFGTDSTMWSGSYKGHFQLGKDAVDRYNEFHKTSDDVDTVARDFDYAAKVTAWYLASIIQELTYRDPSPVRDPEEANKLALAGYNMGPGALARARRAAKAAGRDPNKWSDVRRHLKDAGRDDDKIDEVQAYVWNIRYYEALLRFWSCTTRGA